jgi:hypothetical protein
MAVPLMVFGGGGRRAFLLLVLWAVALAWGWWGVWGPDWMGLFAWAKDGSNIATKPHAEQAWIEDGRSLVIYPPQALALKDFSHALHLQRGSACVDCHAAATQSVRASDVLLPDMQQCVSCHALRTEAGEWACAKCHAEYDSAPPKLDVTVPPNVLAIKQAVHNPPVGFRMQQAPLKFSHQLHTNAAITCEQCHADVQTTTLADRTHLPTMTDCLQCHTGAEGEPTRACNACHLDNADGRLTLTFPTATLVPTRDISGGDHRFDFLKRHETFAAQNDSTCTGCHAQSFCLDCHNGVFKPASFHPPNFSHLHGLEAQAAGTATCTQGCHNLQQFCESCHAITLAGPNIRPLNSPDAHPVGFADDPSSLSFHGPLARRDVASCASCHTEQQCVTCHTAINPHGNDFIGRCAALRTRNEQSCLRCHDPNGGAWRSQCQ